MFRQRSRFDFSLQVIFGPGVQFFVCRWCFLPCVTGIGGIGNKEETYLIRGCCALVRSRYFRRWFVPVKTCSKSREAFFLWVYHPAFISVRKRKLINNLPACFFVCGFWVCITINLSRTKQRTAIWNFLCVWLGFCLIL